MRSLTIALILLAASQMTLDQLNQIQEEEPPPPVAVPYNPGYNPGYGAPYNPGYDATYTAPGRRPQQPPSSGLPGPPQPIVTTPLTPRSPWAHY